MFILNTEAVIAGFVKQAMKDNGYDFNKDIPRSQHKQELEKLTWVINSRLPIYLDRSRIVHQISI